MELDEELAIRTKSAVAEFQNWFVDSCVPGILDLVVTSIIQVEPFLYVKKQMSNSNHSGLDS